MGEFCADVRRLIAGELQLIGATLIEEAVSYETETCFFSAADKIIAITYTRRDGATCYVGDAASTDPRAFKTWDTLWHLLEMDKNIDTDEGLSEYLEMFPTEHEQYIKFMGTCLVKYFARSSDRQAI